MQSLQLSFTCGCAPLTVPSWRRSASKHAKVQDHFDLVGTSLRPEKLILCLSCIFTLACFEFEGAKPLESSFHIISPWTFSIIQQLSCSCGSFRSVPASLPKDCAANLRHYFLDGGCRGHQSSASKFSQIMLRNSFGVVGASSGGTFVSPILTIEVAEGEPQFKKVKCWVELVPLGCSC